MFELIKLRYKLNKEYFFSSSIILKDISETHKKFFFVCYLTLKALLLMSIIFFIELVVPKNQSETYLFELSQLVFFLVCAFYFANVSDAENSKTHIKDFLVGANFDLKEKITNKKKLALLFFCEASALCLLIWMVLRPLVNRVAPINLLVAFILSMVSLLSVFFMNYHSRQQNGSKYWVMQYMLAGFISFGIVEFWHYFEQTIPLTTHEISRMILYLMMCGLIYQIISIFVCLKKVKWQNQKIGGLIGDFIEKYISNSAIVYAAPIVFFNIVSVSQLSKILIIVAYLSLFVMPNVMSLRFLSYYKMVGDSRNILVNYGQVLLFFQLGLALITGILSGVNVINLFLMSALLIGVMTLRILVAILVVRSKHEDGQKTDYYAVSMFAPVMLLAAMAFFWR
ncbi:hypothetical protein ACSFB8_05980 [Enterococcus faecalis]